MLELQCTCGWKCSGETKEELLQQTMAHLPECVDRYGLEPLEEPVVRALIAQRARPLGD